MSDAYRQLLDSAIEHLQSLKTQGVRFVSVAPASLTALNEAPPRPAASTAAPSFVAPPARPAPVAAPKTPAAVVSASPQTAPPKASVPLTPVAAAATPVSEIKKAAYAELRERALACIKCPNLAASRKNVVFGVGNLNAELMFVGEAPGADEDSQGEPFVGLAGQLLTKIIQATGLTRDSVYIANILKCRPDTPGQTSGNRKPTTEEMQTCIPYLHEQIDLIQPKVLVALGATAVEGLLGKTVGITKLRGNWQTYRGIPLMPTYHPAYLLRNQAMSEKRRVWEDMLQVMEKLGLPISEKQRNFFLKVAG
ncbi:MAG: uracil-DNA glycosylase [Akkermansiaceae bacterium]|nr:uracil-DNA glycosylase [Verrucomicrobiales bacterium]